jgi:hypothetical protein
MRLTTASGRCNGYTKGEKPDSWDIFGTLSGWYGSLTIRDGMNYPAVKTAKFKDDRIT